MAAQLVAPGYMSPGTVVQRPFWDEYGIAVIVGIVVLAHYVLIVVANGHERNRLPGEVDRDR